MARQNCPPVVHLGPTMGPAILAGVARLRECVADPDPKVAVRAAAELTKLLAVCARLHIQLDPPEPVPVSSHRPAVVAPMNVSPPAPEREPAVESLRVTADQVRNAAGPTSAAGFSPRGSAVPPIPGGPGSPRPLTSLLGKPPPVTPHPSARAPAGG